MDVSWVIDVVIGLRELAGAARIEAGERRETRRVSQINELIDALRFLYFSPRGILRLLEELADGRYPSEAQIASILPDFNDYEFRVRRMMQRIDPEDGIVAGRLTLRAERALRDISNGKQGLRSRLKDLLNEALTTGNPISPLEARRLRDEILSLNNAIEEAEEALIAALR